MSDYSDILANIVINYKYKKNCDKLKEIKFAYISTLKIAKNCSFTFTAFTDVVEKILTRKSVINYGKFTETDI